MLDSGLKGVSSSPQLGKDLSEKDSSSNSTTVPEMTYLVPPTSSCLSKPTEASPGSQEPPSVLVTGQPCSSSEHKEARMVSKLLWLGEQWLLLPEGWMECGHLVLGRWSFCTGNLSFEKCHGGEVHKETRGLTPKHSLTTSRLLVGM